MLQVEWYVLKTLKWNLSYTNPIYFLQRVSRADDHDVKARTIAQYLIEISCLEWRLLSAPPSLWAAATVWLACLILDNETWVHHSTSFIMCYYLLCIRQTPNLAHHSSYDESQLVPTVNIMLNYVTIHMDSFLSSHTYSTLTHISHDYDSSLPHLLHYDSPTPIVLLLYIWLATHL